MTFSASGRLSSAPGASRSALIISTPFSRSSSTTSGSLKRDTAMTRFSTPAARSAFFARTHSVGPIFPPAPSTRMSPSNLPSSPLSASLGVVSILFSLSSVHISVVPLSLFNKLSACHNGFHVQLLVHQHDVRVKARRKAPLPVRQADHSGRRGRGHRHRIP